MAMAAHIIILCDDSQSTKRVEDATFCTDNVHTKK